MPTHAERDIFVRLSSVCLSVTLWYCMEMNADIVKLLPPPPGHEFSLLSATAVTKFQAKLLQLRR